MALAETTDNTFEQDIKNTQGLVCVDFYAPWCGPCKIVGPLLEELSKELNEVKFFKLNVDENPHVAQSLGISGVPTLILFKDGKQIRSKVGAMNKSELKAFVEA